MSIVSLAEYSTVDLVIWAGSTIANLTLWSGLVYKRGWRTNPELFVLELISALTTLFVVYFHAASHPELWYVKDIVVTLTQLLEFYVLASLPMAWMARPLPLLYGLYSALALLQEHSRDLGAHVDARAIYYVLAWEGLVGIVLLAICVWSDMIGLPYLRRVADMADNDLEIPVTPEFESAAEPTPAPEPVPEPTHPHPLPMGGPNPTHPQGPPGDPPPKGGAGY